MICLMLSATLNEVTWAHPALASHHLPALQDLSKTCALNIVHPFISLSPFILSFLHLLICVYIVWATSPASRQNLLYPLLLRFC
jgi:hypothetical protein